MQSELLSSMGLGNIDIAYILLGMIVVIFILMILIIWQISHTSKLKKKYSKFMQGKDAKSLEKEIIALYEDNKILRATTEENRKNISKLYRNFEYAYQKFGIVKYDAFREMGGQLSFSLALLNDKNDGFIINSVHSTDGCYSYTKEIRNGISSITLGEEEQKAVEQAMTSNQRAQKRD